MIVLLFCAKRTIPFSWFGDFNLPSINWANFESPNDDIHDVFLDFCVQRGLHQMVKECTRDSSCIDLVLTNDVFTVLNMSVTTPFSTSDHCMVDFELLLDQTGSNEARTVTKCYYDYDNADIQSVVNSLWNHPFNSEIWSNNSDINIGFNDSVNDVWFKFLSPIHSAIDEFVPLKTCRRRDIKSNASKTYPRHIRRALSKKHTYWKTYKKTKSSQDKGRYCNQADLCKKLIFDYEKS